MSSSADTSRSMIQTCQLYTLKYGAEWSSTLHISHLVSHSSPTLECKNLLGSMLQPNPANRCSVEEVKWSAWMTKGYDGAPDNHLPSRAPIDHVDEEIVARMKGFGFGTKEEIMEKLQDSIQKTAAGPPLTSTSNSGGGIKQKTKFDVKGRIGRALIHRSGIVR